VRCLPDPFHLKFVLIGTHPPVRQDENLYSVFGLESGEIAAFVV
jgi:hypothetical protein